MPYYTLNVAIHSSRQNILKFNTTYAGRLFICADANAFNSLSDTLKHTVLHMTGRATPELSSFLNHLKTFEMFPSDDTSTLGLRKLTINSAINFIRVHESISEID